MENKICGFLSILKDLKRFSETRWSKLSNIVDFPIAERALNMSPYSANSSSNINYSLYGISNHMGKYLYLQPLSLPPLSLDFS